MTSVAIAFHAKVVIRCLLMSKLLGARVSAMVLVFVMHYLVAFLVAEEERSGCFTLCSCCRLAYFVFLLSIGLLCVLVVDWLLVCCISSSRCLELVCDCCISWLYSLAF